MEIGKWRSEIQNTKFETRDLESARDKKCTGLKTRHYIGPETAQPSGWALGCEWNEMD